MRTFLSIYRNGSLSAAARELNMTQPAVTGHLKSLEGQLGKPLFERQARGVHPTLAGDELARSVEPMIDGLEKVYRSARRDADDLSGTLRLGGPAELLSARVFPALAEVSHSGIRVRTRLGEAAELIRDLEAGALDLVVATVRISRKSIDYLPVYEEGFHLVAAPKWARAACTLRDMLDRVPLLAYDETLPIVRRYFQTQGISVEGRSASLTVPDLRGLLACAIAGGGMTVLPGYLCERAIESGELVRLPTGKRVAPNIIYLAGSKQSLRSPRTAFVRDVLARASRRW
ncbi:MAG: LysR family transcriptional regulator [Rhodospirillales bacterium]|nr:LysR family transcriptional regulator [Rhodospirillales bacterium]